MKEVEGTMKSDRMFASFRGLVRSSRIGRDDDVDSTVIVFGVYNGGRKMGKEISIIDDKVE